MLWRDMVAHGLVQVSLAKTKNLVAMLRIRDIFPGSRILDPTFSVPDPGLARSRIRILVKEFKYF